MALCIRAGASGITLVALGLSLSACGGSQDAAVNEVARDFYAAIAQDDGPAACDLLVPATRTELEQSSGKECATAILEEAADVRADDGTVEVFDSMAQVRWGRDVAFLSRMQDGWRVLALGCTPQPAAPYDCQVEGG